MQAAAKGQLDIVEHLAGEQGAVIGAKKPDGYTALIFEVGHEALMQNKRRALKQLLPQGSGKPRESMIDETASLWPHPAKEFSTERLVLQDSATA